MCVVKLIPLLLLAVSFAAVAVDAPEAEISAKNITAKLYLPDAANGYYRGTRFDWSGQIPSLRANNHDYFGVWFPKYDPKLHDAIEGPVEEFISEGDTSIGYNEAKVGDTFVRIGVGAVRKPDDKPYQRFRTYDIVDPGKWTIDKKKDHITFRQELKDTNGYAYVYTKTVRVDGSKPVLTIEHSLKNTGSKPLNTMQYDHNFFMIDGKPTGPDASVTFPFDLTMSGRPFNTAFAETQGKKVVYKKELGKGESAATELAGFGPTSSDYDFRIENAAAKAGVRIQGDKPIKKIVYWSITTTLCPEAYIDVSADPGKETKWKYTYTFYDLK